MFLCMSWLHSQSRGAGVCDGRVWGGGATTARLATGFTSLDPVQINENIKKKKESSSIKPISVMHTLIVASLFCYCRVSEMFLLQQLRSCMLTFLQTQRSEATEEEIPFFFLQMYMERYHTSSYVIDVYGNIIVTRSGTDFGYWN